MQTTRHVILISGTPGTGKTTIALSLKESLSALCLNLTEIAIKNDFILEKDAKRLTLVVDLEKMVSHLENIITSSEGNIIIEGHYTDIVPNSLISVFFILRTKPSVLKTRLEEKGFPPSKVIENLQSEILGSCTQAALETHDLKKIYEIETSQLSKRETIDQILTILKEFPPSNVGEINWMQKLDEKNELLKYFP